MPNVFLIHTARVFASPRIFIGVLKKLVSSLPFGIDYPKKKSAAAEPKKQKTKNKPGRKRGRRHGGKQSKAAAGGGKQDFHFFWVAPLGNHR